MRWGWSGGVPPSSTSPCFMNLHVKSIIFKWKEVNVIFAVVVLNPRTSPICAELHGPTGVFQVSEPEAHGRSVIRMERDQIHIGPKPVCARASWRSALSPCLWGHLRQPLAVVAEAPNLSREQTGCPEPSIPTGPLPFKEPWGDRQGRELRVWVRPGVCPSSEGALCDGTFWNDGNVLNLPCLTQ